MSRILIGMVNAYGVFIGWARSYEVRRRISAEQGAKSRAGEYLRVIFWLAFPFYGAVLRSFRCLFLLNFSGAYGNFFFRVENSKKAPTGRTSVDYEGGARATQASFAPEEPICAEKTARKH